MKKVPAHFLAFVLSLGIAALTGGCIYFNLMYNAETSFDTAYRAHRKLIKDNPDSNLVLPADIDKGYKKTIDKCNSVFEIYPKKKKWHSEALFLLGKAYFFDGEYDRAIHSFKQVQERFPASPFVGESHLYTGRAYLKKEDLDKAEQVFTFVLEKYPSLNRNQEVTLLMAEIAIHREGKSQALELLEKTYATVKTPEKKLELAVKIAQLYKDVKLYGKALALLESAPRPKELPDQLFRVDFLRVTCYAENGAPGRAIELLSTMLGSKPYVSHIPALLLKKGEILDRLNKTDEAMALFKQIIDIYPSSDFVGNAWFELGRINQVKKNDQVKAKECYDKAAGALKDQQLKDLATQRSKAIDAVVKMRQATGAKDTAKSDSVTPANYKIGELFWLELDQPDSAFRYYCLSARDTLHRALIPKALYSAAWIARYALADSMKADSLCRLLISRFPANSYSRKAQEAQGGPVTVMTRQDSALNAFHLAERMYWEDNNPDSAAEAYVNVYNMYPETDYGSKSLFAAAWIYDFVVDKNRTAKKLYEQVCDSFPKSSYCLEAKPRLKTVADTLAVLKAQKKLPQRDNAPAAPVASNAAQGAVKKPDSLHSAPGTIGEKSGDIITEGGAAAKKLPPGALPSVPSAPQPVTPAPAAPPIQPMPMPSPVQPAGATPPQYRGKAPVVNVKDTISSGTVPAAKPDSILKSGPIKSEEIIGQ
jgi:TolA-binding protein